MDSWLNSNREMARYFVSCHIRSCNLTKGKLKQQARIDRRRERGQAKAARLRARVSKTGLTQLYQTDGMGNVIPRRFHHWIEETI